MRIHQSAAYVVRKPICNFNFSLKWMHQIVDAPIYLLIYALRFNSLFHLIF